ncbi:unnamed protein product [Rhizoctonia solani]|uniref:Lysine-specific metallo-endopeptidase domain-containing protein n=1 Tax=Rhizoctonia solani TaxID=456999 RepID=A0A8H3DIK6_9AGAM|nr:unnamed protein product [Rhizoctonia solani]
MLVTAAFVLFTALLASADGSLSLKPVGRTAGVTDIGASGGKRMLSKTAKALSGALPSRKTPRYAGCSAEQQKKIVTAVKGAQGYASAASTHLKSNSQGSTLYTRWFGTFDQSLYNVILGGFDRFFKQSNKWTYDCTCTNSELFVKVSTNRPGIVDPPAPGHDFRAFAIIREGVRFNEVFGAINHILGLQPSLALAKENNGRAAYNADNNAYFALEAYEALAGTSNP